MRQQQSLLSITFFLILGVAAVVCVRAAEPPQAAAPDGKVKQVSDWAVAGIVWSDASLARKVAGELAKKEGLSADEKKQLQQVERKLEIMVEELENFGWRRIGSKQRAAKPSMGDAATRAAGVNRLDTETPAGADDPNMDDELQQQDFDVDVDQYRVDDVVDETPREASNPADAIEDEVEGAIAATTARIGTADSTAGRISRREAQTQSATMPVAYDTIYDRDDFDPDVDYEYENPRGPEPPQPTPDPNIVRGDMDDDVEVGDPVEIAQGEDELTAALARSGDQQVVKPAPIGELGSYTDRREEHSQEADLIQYRLEANQTLWQQLSKDTVSKSDLQFVMHLLQSDAAVGINSTTSDRLQEVLQRITSLTL